MSKLVCKLGIFDIERLPKDVSDNVYFDFIYQAWMGMLSRVNVGIRDRNRGCYNTYSDVTVSENFIRFSYFYNWIISLENFNDIMFYRSFGNGRRVVLEKDIIKRGNREYHEDYCCLVPAELNCLAKVQRKQGDDGNRYPVGLSKLNKDTIRAVVSRGILYEDIAVDNFYIKEANKHRNADRYRQLAVLFYTAKGFSYREEELSAIGMAFEWYKKTKSDYLSDIATTYSDHDGLKLIDSRCYNALMNWEIKITD